MKLVITREGEAKRAASSVTENGVEHEAALIKAFYANRLVVEALENRKRAQVGGRGGLRTTRQATAIGAILRRWFVGKQTTERAAQTTTQLRDGLLDQRIFMQNTALVGTAALLDIASSADFGQRQLVQVIDAAEKTGYALFRLGVETNSRGRPPKKGTRPYSAVPLYYVHQSIVEACRHWASGYEARRGCPQPVQNSTPTCECVEDGAAWSSGGDSEAWDSEHSDASFSGREEAWNATDQWSGSSGWDLDSDGLNPVSPEDQPWLFDDGELWTQSDLHQPLALASGASVEVTAADAAASTYGAATSHALSGGWTGYCGPGGFPVYSSAPTSAKRGRDSDQMTGTCAGPSTKASKWAASNTATGATIKSKSVVGKSAMLMIGFPFVAFALVFTAYVFARDPSPQLPSDGWNCDPNLVITFDDSGEICNNNNMAIFPCSFECPPGSIGVGRTCRCDGCFRDGHCMAWDMVGLAAGKTTVAGCPDLFAWSWQQGGLAHQVGEWPHWQQREDKIPGISESPSVLWHDEKNNQLLLHLFPTETECPQSHREDHDKQYGRASHNKSKPISWMTGACPASTASTTDPWGKHLEGVWTHNLTNGSGWKRWDVYNTSEWWIQPGSRNDALTFAGADSFFIFGGKGSASTGYSGLSDMWVLHGATSVDTPVQWVQLSPGLQPLGAVATSEGQQQAPGYAEAKAIGEGAAPTWANAKEWPTPVRSRSSWSTRCDQTSDPGCSDGALWMFGGQSDGDIGPMNTLWQYRYTSPEKLGNWTLVTGSPYDVVGHVLGLQKLGRERSVTDWEDRAYQYAQIQAVDECAETWPVVAPRDGRPNATDASKLPGSRVVWITPQQCRCPMARYSAATWSGSSSSSTVGGWHTGGWMFGGMTPWPANLSTVIQQTKAAARHGDKNPLATVLHAMFKTVRALADLWHFNGNAERPVWTQIQPDASNQKKERSAWPPPAIGQGWQSHGQLWLWVAAIGEQPACNYISCDKHRILGKDDQVTNQLWVFSPTTALWEYVTEAGVDAAARIVDSQRFSSAVPDDELFGAVSGGKFGAWPGPREEALVSADGSLFSGFGRAECTIHGAAGAGTPSLQPRSLSGLWRWVEVGPRDLGHGKQP